MRVSFEDIVLARDEKTRVFLELLERLPEEKPMRLVYYKVREGRMVERVWRSQ